jgi:hypothetical protein
VKSCSFIPKYAENMRDWRGQQLKYKEPFGSYLVEQTIPSTSIVLCRYDPFTREGRRIKSNIRYANPCTLKSKLVSCQAENRDVHAFILQVSEQFHLADTIMCDKEQCAARLSRPYIAFLWFDVDLRCMIKPGISIVVPFINL